MEEPLGSLCRRQALSCWTRQVVLLLHFLWNAFVLIHSVLQDKGCYPLHCRSRFWREFAGFGDFLDWLKQSLFTARHMGEQGSDAGFPHWVQGRWRSGKTRSHGDLDAPELSGACSWHTSLSAKLLKGVIPHSRNSSTYCFRRETIDYYILFKRTWCKSCKGEIAAFHPFPCALLQGSSQAALWAAVPRADGTTALTVFLEAPGADMKGVPRCCCLLGKTQTLYM